MFVHLLDQITAELRQMANCISPHQETFVAYIILMRTRDDAVCVHN
jgi:hypothetical protein